MYIPQWRSRHVGMFLRNCYCQCFLLLLRISTSTQQGYALPLCSLRCTLYFLQLTKTGSLCGDELYVFVTGPISPHEVPFMSSF